MKQYLLVLVFICACMGSIAQTPSERMARTAMSLWKDSFSLKPGAPAKWSYDQGVILKGIEGIWNRTGNGEWFQYIQKSMDFYVREDGSIKGYRPDEYNIDHINNGKLLLLLYRVTGKDKYRKAASLLRSQLTSHPRTAEGGFFHKKIYTSQMWLDGLYMGQPFYAEYASVFGDDSAFNDITRQFVLMEKNARDPQSGLLYHGYDESRQQAWADKTTGRSPHVWGRALGWYGMALVDALDHFPLTHPGRDSLIAILGRFAAAVRSVQDEKTGLWYDIPNMPQELKNYFEASASSMLVYTLAKGVRKGYLPSTYRANAMKGFGGITRQFIKRENGQTNLHGTVAVSGLGGKPYRDGSFAYYMSEPVIVNDAKGVGAFILAANEIEMLPSLGVGQGKTVLLDNFFNHEIKKDALGRNQPWHYIWSEKANGGFSMLGDIFNRYGVKTETLAVAPTAQNLAVADIYLIVDPDTEKETPAPNYILQPHINAIVDWVNAGGILLVFANDSANVEMKHLNELMARFGIQFNEHHSRNMVKLDDYPTGSFNIKKGHPVLKTAKKVYLKEISTLTLTPPATSVHTDGKDVIMAVSKMGKGAVFAVGDPWIYNEYIDGRKLPADFTNYAAAEDIVRWAIERSKKARPAKK